MVKTGSIDDRIIDSVLAIARGRVFLDTPKIEAIGRVTLKDGLVKAKEAFKDADATSDLKTILQAELTFVKQELLFAPDKYAEANFRASATDLADALYALTAHDNKIEYLGADKTYSTRRPADRKEKLPYDVVHKTLKSEVARLLNSMRSNVMSSVERELTQQRVENMRHGQTLYKQLQRETLKKGDRDFEM